MQKLTRSLLAIGAVVGLAACGDDVTVTPPPVVTPTVTAVTVSPASATIKVGETVVFSASLQTTGTVTNTAVTWSSASTTIATVSATGSVTGVAAGTTTIRATSQANTSVSGAGAVTVVAPGVQSVSVTPNAATLTVGQTLTAVANVTRDAGVAGTVTWSTSAASIATVSTAGVITGVVPGTAVITATSTADATKSASLSVTVTAQPNALISLTVTPGTVNIGPGGTLALTTIAQAATGGTVSYASTSSNPAIATVTASGANPTITGVANGTAVVTITATGTGAGLATNSISQTVTVNVNAAAVSIASLTACTGGPPCVVGPVNLAATMGQIEATLNINSGNQQIDRVVVYIDSDSAAAQVFGVNGAPNAPVTLSINTAYFNPTTYAPRTLNGVHTLVAKIYPTGPNPSPTASNTVQFTLTNPDVVYFNPTGQVHTGNSAAGLTGTWWKGGFTVASHPVAYSASIDSIRYTVGACGSAVGTAGPSYVATYSCAGVETAGNNALAAITVYYPASYTLTAPPVAFMTAASAGFVPGNPVWVATNYNSNEDNVGPSISVVAFTNGLTSVGSDNWAGSPTTWAATATDAGVGMTATSASAPAQTDVSSDGGTTWSPTNISNPNSLAETLTGTGYLVSGAPGTDLLGNTNGRGPNSASFGVDLVVLDAQYADRPTSALATIFPLTQNGTIYAEATPTVTNPSWTATNDGATEVVAADAIDTRSGLDNPNAQVSTLVRRTAAGSSSCASGASAMATILGDGYVQTTTPAQLDCGLAAGSRVGYYTWIASVKDRAGNAKKVTTDGTTALDSVYLAIDEAAPNITGLGFQTALYAGGSPANYGISANDDLELKDGQVALTYAAMTPTVTFPYGSSAFSSAPFGVPFDATFSNVINGSNLTLSYYIVRYDFVTAAPFVPGGAPSGNVATFTTSGLNNFASGSVRDVANQTATLAPVPVLSTQIADRTAAPSYTSSMIHWAVTGNAGGVITVRHTGPTSTTLTYCDRVDIYEGAGGVAGADVSTLAGTITYRTTITAPAGISDNGFQRFWDYTSAALSPAIGAGNAIAVCIKGGSALVSRTF